MIFKHRKLISLLTASGLILSLLPVTYGANHGFKVFLKHSFDNAPGNIWDERGGVHYYVRSDEGYGRNV